ncbi:hypothetical protein QBE52_05865 [Clostridiaceae bacterium 35-E11]
MLIRFMIYGLIGWCIEITWTGLGSAFSGDKKLTGYTYLWMFPIYGLAVLLEPVHDMIVNWPWVLRGGIWIGMIYLIEYITGWLIQSYTGRCPWDYGNTKYAVKGLIRLDYAPAWLLAGLLFERIHVFLDRIFPV